MILRTSSCVREGIAWLSSMSSCRRIAMKYIAYNLVLAVTLAVSQAQGAHHAAAPARAVVAATTVAHASAPHAVHPTVIQAAFQASCSYTVQPGDTLSA